MKELPLDELSAAHFEQMRGTNFRVLAKSGTVELELVAVAGQTSTGNETFSLLFNGPAEPALEQRTYRFEHPAIGAFDLFIVPVGAEGGRRQYEAVFNRRKSF